MERQVQNSVLIFSIFIAFFFVPITSSINIITPIKHPFFIFGDSMLDVGNNNYINTSSYGQANIYPYGITFFHHPTGRHSDGRLICDFIAQYANLPLIPPFLQRGEPTFYNGVNFASAGCGALVQTFQGLVIDLNTQLSNFKKVDTMFKNKFGHVQAKKRLFKAVYLLSAGGNDYLGTFLPNGAPIPDYTQTDFVNMVIANITSLVTEIYKIGGRKFAFLNVPPVECAPAARMLNESGDCLSKPSNYIIHHNRLLVHALKELKMKLPGFKFSLYDFHDNIQWRIDYPSHYGFKEGKTACCGSGEYRGIISCGGKGVTKEFELCENIDDHVYWDSLHLTEETYRQLANDMWKSRSYGSYSIRDLFHLP